MFYPGHIRKLLVKKKRDWGLYKKFRSTVFHERYKRISSDCRSEIFQFIAKREESLISAGNLGKFYRYANSRLGSKTNVGPLRLPDGSLTIDPVSKASLLSEHFGSTFTLDDGLRPNPGLRLPGASLTSVSFSQQSVYRILRKLKANSAGGPDCIPPVFLTQLCAQLSAPIAFLYQLFFDFAFIPAVWLEANITPIFKKGDSALPSNYRPISLTCTLCKVMESVIKQQVICYLLQHGFISKEQHAFLARHSTVTNLLESVHDWALSFHYKIPQDVIYFDFARAFDSVIHSKLLIKLQSFGIDGPLLSWICAFLSSRVQRVTAEGVSSEWVKVISGVPQGSVLGPVLFLMYIDDVTLIYPGLVTYKLFADDLKIYSSVDSAQSSVDLHTTLLRLEEWCRTWQLVINVSKTSVVHLGYNNPRASYSFNGAPIVCVTSVRDLGVDIDSGLTFDSHINKMLAKAYSRVGSLFRGFSTRNVNVLRQAYITYIRPLLEYASNVWCPYLLKHINAIEKVQRNFSKRIPALRKLSYQERLALLDLETLEYRRLKADLALYYKIMHNLTPWPADRYFSFSADNRHTRATESRGNFHVSPAFCRTVAYQNDFLTVLSPVGTACLQMLLKPCLC